MKITKLLSLLLLSLVFSSNGCNEDDENENLAVEENCDAPRCYVSKHTETYYDDDSVDEDVYEDIFEYKMIGGKKTLDRITSKNDYIEFFYDDNNRMIGRKNYTQTGRFDSEYTIFYTVDGKRGKTTETYYYSGGREKTHTFEYSYNSEGKLVSVKEYEDGNYEGKRVIQSYNLEGQYSLIYMYDREDNIFQTFEFEYDNCNTTGNQRYVSNNLRENILFFDLFPFFPKCDVNCSMSKTTREFAGKSYDIIYEYNTQGLLKKNIVYDEDGEILSESEFEYECD
ncbi:hypothetical protein [Bernardetia sp. MNP-M8]|uniref:hypothetical protein n=1 Tax=Bernardetia sp. MNP-M8 TaxID=3127470 RepID=UPI0030CBDB2F